MARRFTHLPDLPTYQRDTEQIQQIHPYRMAASPHPDGLRKGSFVQSRPPDSLPAPIGDIPSRGYEQIYYRNQAALAMVAGGH